MNALVVSVLCIPVLGLAWFHFICQLMLHHRSSRNRAVEVAGTLGLRFPSLRPPCDRPWIEVAETLEREFEMLFQMARECAQIRDVMGGEIWMLAVGFHVAALTGRLVASIWPWLLEQCLTRMWLATATMAECIGDYRPVRRKASPARFLAKAGGVRI
ncbi:MAG: hypothetical protein U0Q16_33205 [Bryobacteraceae bacterium]